MSEGDTSEGGPVETIVMFVSYKCESSHYVKINSMRPNIVGEHQFAMSRMFFDMCDPIIFPINISIEHFGSDFGIKTFIKRNKGRPTI